MAFNSIAVNYDPELIIVIINDLWPPLALPPPSPHLSPSEAAHKTDDRQKVIPHILHKLLHIKKQKKPNQKVLLLFCVFVSRAFPQYFCRYFTTLKNQKIKGIQNISLRYI